MQPVTDPAILAQLNGGQVASGGDVPQGLTPVTDPTTLAQLNGTMDKKRGANADVPSYLDPRTTLGHGLQIAGDVMQKFINPNYDAAKGKDNIFNDNPLIPNIRPAGVIGGLNELGEGIGQKIAQATGTPQEQAYATRGIQGVEQGLANQPQEQTGAAVGRNALMAAAPANAVGVGLMTAANRMAAPDTTGQQTLGDTAISAAEQGIEGGLGAKAISVIAPKVISALTNGTPGVSTSADFKALANAQYQKANDVGGMLSPKVTNGFIQKATDTLKPQSEAGMIVSGETEASKMADRLGQLAGKPLSLQAAQEVDEGLSNAIDKEYGLKGLSKDGKNILDLQNHFRQAIEAATPENGGVLGNKDGFEALKQGRNYWRTAAQLRDVESVVSKAQLSDNPATAIRSGFKTLANNPGRMKGYDPEIQGLIRKAAKTGLVGDTLRVAGSRLVPIIAGGAGFAGGGGIGAVPAWATAEGVSFAARKAAQGLAQNKAGNVVNAILSKSASRMAPQAAEAAPVASRVAGGITRSPMSSQQGSANSDTAKALGVGSAAGLGGAAYFANQNKPKPPQEPNESGQDAMLSMPPPPVSAAPVSATMPMHDELGDFIKSLPTAQQISRTVVASEESTRPKAYTDKNGFKTVGTGFNMDAPNAKAIWKRAGVPENFSDVYNGKNALSNSSIQALFNNTSDAAAKAAQKLVPNYDKLGDNQKAALNSLAFQLGGTGLAKFRNMLNYLAQGNAKAVENSLINSKLGQQDSPARARRTALMLAYDIPHDQADAILAQQGRIKPTERKYR